MTSIYTFIAAAILLSSQLHKKLIANFFTIPLLSRFYFKKWMLLNLMFSCQIAFGQVPEWTDVQTEQSQDQDVKYRDMVLDTANQTFVIVGTFEKEITETRTRTHSVVKKLTKEKKVIWTKVFENVILKHIDVDAAGNVYVAGDYRFTPVRFDHIELKNNNYFLPALGTEGYLPTYDFVVAKLSASGGAVQWAENSSDKVAVSDYELCNYKRYNEETGKSTTEEIFEQLPGGKDEFINDLKVDAFGKVYITGYFTSKTLSIGDITLDNPWKTDFLNAEGKQIPDGIAEDCRYIGMPAIFTAQYAQSSGDLQWIKTEEGEHIVPIEEPTDIFTSSIDLAKYGQTIGNHLGIDDVGNVYVSAEIAGDELLFGGQSWTHKEGAKFLTIKYKPSGVVEWTSDQISGQMVYDGRRKEFAAVSSGYQEGKWSHYFIKFKPNKEVTHSRLLPAHRGVPLSAQSGISGISLDDSSNVYIAGHFHQRQDFEYTNSKINSTYNQLVSQDTCKLESIGASSMVIKFDTLFNAYWGTNTKLFNGTGQSKATAIVVDSGKVYVAGYFGKEGTDSKQLFGPYHEEASSGPLRGYFAKIEQHPMIKIHLRKQSYSSFTLPTHFELWGRNGEDTHSYLFDVKEYEDERADDRARYGIFNPTLKTLNNISDLYILQEEKLLGKIGFRYTAKDGCHGRRKEAYVILHDDLMKYKEHPTEKNNSGWKFKERYKYIYNTPTLLQFGGVSTGNGNFYQTTMFIAPGFKEKNGHILEEKEGEDLLDGDPVIMVCGYTGTDNYWGENVDIYDRKPGEAEDENLDRSKDGYNDKRDYLYSSYTARIQEKLGSGSQVWEFYHPSDQSWLETGYLFGTSLDRMLDEFYRGKKASIVAHSMGGLITRAYTEGLAENYLPGGHSKLTIPYKNNIEKVLFLATPHHGAFTSNRLYWGIFMPGFASGLLKDDFSPAARVLGAGHKAFALLNDKTKPFLNDLPKLNKPDHLKYFQVSGTTYKGITPGAIDRPLVTESFANDDGAASISSANLLAFGVPLVLLEDFSHQHLNSPDNDDVPLSTEEQDYIPRIAAEFIKSDISAVSNSSIFSWYGTDHKKMPDRLVAKKEGSNNIVRTDIVNPIVLFNKEEDGKPWLPSQRTGGRPIRFKLDVHKLKPNSTTSTTSSNIIGLSSEFIADPLTYNAPGQYLYYGANNLWWNFTSPFRDFDKKDFQDEFTGFYPYRVGTGGPWVFYPDSSTDVILSILTGGFAKIALKALDIKRLQRLWDWKGKLDSGQTKLEQIFQDPNPLDLENESSVYGKGLGWHLPNQESLSLPVYFEYFVKRRPLDKKVHYFLDVKHNLQLDRSLTTYNNIELNWAARKIIESEQRLYGPLLTRIDNLTEGDFINGGDLQSPDDRNTSVASTTRNSTLTNNHNWVDCNTYSTAFVLEYNDNPEPELTLESPSNKTISTSDVNDTNIFYYHNSDLRVKYFLIDDPTPGKWQVLVNGQGTLPDSTYQLSYPMEVDNWNLTYLPDTLTRVLFNVFVDSVVIATTLEDVTLPIEGMKILADAYDSKGIAQAVIFKDDGIGADSIAGDKIFTSVFSPTDTGKFTIVTDIIGTMNGCNFIREGSIDVYAYPGRDNSEDVNLLEILLSEGGCDDPRIVQAVINNKDHFTTLNKVQINWEKNGGTKDSLIWTGEMKGNYQDTILLETILLTPNEALDLKVWTSLPNDLEDIHPSDDTLRVQLAARTNAGDYTVGGTGDDFPDIATAVRVLDSLGICDTTRLLLRSGVYKEQIVIDGGIKGASELTPFIITSASGNPADVVITYAAQQAGNRKETATVYLRNTSGIIFQEVTIEQGNEFTVNASVITLVGSTGPNFFINNIIRSETGAFDNLEASLVISNGSSGDQFIGNTFIGGVVGLYVYTPKNIPISQRQFISNNTFRGQGLYSLLANNISNATITGNQITTEDFSQAGIFIGELSGISVDKNFITLPSGGRGIWVYDCVGTADNPTILSNNAISLSAGSAPSHGIFLQNSKQVHIVFNSVNFYNTTYQREDNSDAAISIFYSGALKILNNNFSNLGASAVAIYSNDSYEGWEVDYNNYFGLYSAVNGNLIATARKYLGSLEAWQKESGLDLHSLAIDPDFVADTDLHIQNPVLNGRGIPIEGIDQDFDGETRQSARPDIGADEIKGTAISAFRFNGICDKVIRWDIVEQLEVASFELEYGREKDNLETVATFDGVGTTEESTSFEWPFEDGRINQVYYFRIRIIAVDGSISYSETFRLVPEFPEIIAEKEGLCAGRSTTLEAFGGDSYQWSTGESGTTIEVQPTQNTSYFVTISEGPDCQHVDSILISVVEVERAESITVQTCGKEQIFLQGELTSDKHSWTPQTNLLNPTEGTVIASPTQNTTYIYQGTHAFGCAVSKSFTIEVVAGFSVQDQIVSPTSFDARNGSISLQTSGGQAPYQYEWSTGSTSAALQNIGIGNYTVRITDATGCSLERVFDLKAPFLDDNQCQGWRILDSNNTAGSLKIYDYQVSKDGDFYLTGSFTGDVLTFKGQQFFNPSEEPAMVLLKLDAARNLVWGKIFPLVASRQSVFPKLVLGHKGIYLYSSYHRSIMIDGEILPKLSSVKEDHFLAAFTEEGNLSWIKSYHGSFFHPIRDAIINKEGNLLVLLNLAANGEIDGIRVQRDAGKIALVTYDAATGGVQDILRFAKNFTRSVFGGQISQNAVGDLFISGYYEGSLEIGAATLPVPPEGKKNLFLSKINTQSKTVAWTQTASFNNYHTTPTIRNVLGADGSVYIGGSFNEPIIFGTTTIARKNRQVNDDIFIARYNQVDGQLDWVKTVEGTASLKIQDFQIDQHSSLYFTINDPKGTLEYNSKIFQPKSPRGSHYLLKVNRQGDLEYQQPISNVLFPKLHLNPNGTVLLGASFNKSITDGETTIYSGNTSPSSNYDYFLAELAPRVSNNLELELHPTWNVNQNTGNIVTTINGGATPYTYNWSPNLTGATLTNIPAGTYELTVTDEEACSTTKQVVIDPTIDQALCSEQAITWEQKFPIEVRNRAAAVAVDSEGSTYFAGSSAVNMQLSDKLVLRPRNLGTTDSYLVKYDKAGNVVFGLMTASSARYDAILDVYVDEQDYVYIVGFFESYFMTFSDVSIDTRIAEGGSGDRLVTMKLSKDGHVVWQRSHNKVHRSAGMNIIGDQQGNIYVAGKSIGEMTFDEQSFSEEDFYFIIKYSNYGEIAWVKPIYMNTRSYGISGESESSIKMVTDRLGNLYVTANYLDSLSIDNELVTSTVDFAHIDCALFKINTAGNVDWIKNYSDRDENYFSDIDISANGNLLVAAQDSYFRMTPEGEIFGNRTIEDVYGTSSIEEDIYGNIYLGVYTEGDEKLEHINLGTDWERRGWVAHFSAEDSLLNAYSLGRVYVSDIATSPDGNVYFASETYGGNQFFRSLEFQKISWQSKASLIDLGADTTTCQEQLVLDAGTNFSAYQWSTGETSPTINVANTGLYIVTVTNGGQGCQDTDSIYVEFDKGDIELDFSYEVDGMKVQLNASSTNDATITNYLWDFGNGITTSTPNSDINYTYTSIGSYEVQLTIEGACNFYPVTKTITIAAPAVENNPTLCADGVDNDGDGFIDSQDSDCGEVTNSEQAICCDNFCLQVITSKAAAGQANGRIEIAPYNITDFVSYGAYSTDGQLAIYFSGGSLFADNVSMGTYSIEVYDANNTSCTKTITVVVEEANSCQGFAGILSIEDQSCTYNTHTVTVSGGTAPFIYDWTSDGLHTTTTFVPTTSHIGQQLLTIKDANNCSFSTSYNVPSLNKAVTANFSYELKADRIDFTDLSTGAITTTQWTFNTPTGIVNNSTPLPPAGSYEICRIVRGDCSVEDTFCQTITIQTSTVDADQDGYTSEEDPDDTDPCVPEAKDANCQTNPDPNPVTGGTGGNTSNPIFDDYPWLKDLINENDCTGSSISVYQSGAYQYLFVDGPAGGTLYFQDGTFYCNNTNGYDCVSAYNLTDKVKEWECGAITETPLVDADQDGYTTATDPDDTDPCVPEAKDASCQTSSGPDTSENTPDPIFEDYPWLKDLINENDCVGSSIYVYQSGAYQYLFVDRPTGGTLYFQDGTFYCNSTNGYDCVSAYNLINKVKEWSCEGRGSLNKIESLLINRKAQTFASFLDKVNIRLYPNPSLGNITLQFDTFIDKAFTIEIYNATFQQVQFLKVAALNNNKIINLDLSNQSVGMYMLKLNLGNQVVSKRFIIQ